MRKTGSHGPSGGAVGASGFPVLDGLFLDGPFLDGLLRGPVDVLRAQSLSVGRTATAQPGAYTSGTFRLGQFAAKSGGVAPR